MNKERKAFYVFQDWVARRLAEAGHTYITREDLKNRAQIVYVFENSPEVKELFSSIMDEQQ